MNIRGQWSVMSALQRVLVVWIWFISAVMLGSAVATFAIMFTGGLVNRTWLEIFEAAVVPLFVISMVANVFFQRRVTATLVEQRTEG